MPYLNSLFDYQKIAEDPRLQSIIDETHSRFFAGSELLDDELENVAGGQAVNSPKEDPAKSKL